VFEITYNISFYKEFIGLYKYKIRMKELVYINVSSVYNLEKIIIIILLLFFFYRVRNQSKCLVIISLI